MHMKLRGDIVMKLYFSGYTVEDIKGLAHELNAMLHKKPKQALATIKNKYSHK